jgi:hypothetical protein
MMDMADQLHAVHAPRPAVSPRNYWNRVWFKLAAISIYWLVMYFVARFVNHLVFGPSHSEATFTLIWAAFWLGSVSWRLIRAWRARPTPEQGTAEHEISLDATQ